MKTMDNSRRKTTKPAAAKGAPAGRPRRKPARVLVQNDRMAHYVSTTPIEVRAVERAVARNLGEEV